MISKNVIIKKFSGIYSVAIIIFILFGTISAYIEVKSTQSSVDQEIQKTTETINERTNEAIDFISNQLRFIGSKISASYNSKRSIDRILSSFSKDDSFVGSPYSWNAYSWINKKNKVEIDGNLGIMKKQPDVSGRDYMRFTRFNVNKVIIGNSVNGVLSRSLIVPIAMGIFNRYQTYSGTLVYGLDIRKFNKKINQYINRDLYKFLIFRNGDILFSSDNFDESLINKIQDRVKVLSLSDKEIKSFTSKQSLLFGDEFNSFFSKDKSRSVGVLVVMDSKAYKNILLKSLLKSVSKTILMAVVLLLIFKILHNRIVRPVSHLSEYIDQIAKKNFNFKIQKPINKELYGIFDSLNLISERFEKEQSTKKQLVEINKKIVDDNMLKNHLLEAICYDLKEPLFAIVDDAKKIPGNDKISKKIINHVDEALKVAEDLSDISQSNPKTIFAKNKQKTNPTHFIQKSITLCSNLAKEKTIDINLTDNNPKDIYIDPKRLRQAMVNILTKVISISRPNSSIAIELEDIFRDQNKILQICISTNFVTKKNAGKDSDARTEQQKLDLEESFEKAKILIKKMDGNFALEQRKGNNHKILITFLY